MERAQARIDLGAVRANCERMRAELGGARLCAVVKADGYGHGADTIAEAALAGGAAGFAVATAGEARLIGRRLQHMPLLTMGWLTSAEVDVVLAAGSEVGVWGEDFRALLAARARAMGRPAASHQVRQRHGPARHLRPGRGARPGAGLRGRSLPPRRRHLDPLRDRRRTRRRRGYFFEQLDRFEPVAAAMRAEFPEVTVHAANSAAVFRSERSHFDMARCGVALTGSTRSRTTALARPRARPLAALLRRLGEALPAGQSAGYGRRWRAPVDPGSGSFRSATATASAAR